MDFIKQWVFQDTFVHLDAQTSRLTAKQGKSLNQRESYDFVL